MDCVSEWIVLYTNYFNFQFYYLHTFYKPNNIKTKPSTKVIFKLIFKFSTIKGQISAPLWTHMGHKGWRKDGKTFIRCYTFALKFWDEFNANFVLLYFSSYSSIEMWHLCLKNVDENNKAVHLRLILTYQYEETSCIGTPKELSIYFSVYSKLS